jgi:hypothetical protein
MNNSNPFGRELPVLVMLRNRQFAVIEAFVEVGTFGMQGRGPFLSTADAIEHTESATPACTPMAACLWRGDNARWREDSASHSLDIIAQVTRDAMTGECVYTALTRAAGQQKKEAP